MMKRLCVNFLFTKKAGWAKARLLVLIFIALCLMTGIVTRRQSAAEAGDDAASKTNGAKDERAALVESALYTRVEFFGAQALVPYPTAEARNRLAEVQEKAPGEPQILLKLSELDEKLGREEQALDEIQSYVRLQPSNDEALEKLADFSHRRAQFVMEAAALERLLPVAPEWKRASVLQRLLWLAHAHNLEKYLAPGFYEQVIAQDPTAFEIIEAYLDQLIQDKNYADALKVLRQYKGRFPERSVYLIEREVSILDAMGQSKEAERVYTSAFDPFWPENFSESFYQFLKDHDRFRAYGYELREAFRRDPANFDAAVRLAHYSSAAYRSDPSVFVQLEKARAQRGINWKPEELSTVARLLIANGYADAASRFLYTLYAQGGMKPGSELRAKVLYQLFELMSDAADDRIALTKGDLKFYEDIAGADPHPGMLGGILSLVLNDTDPASEFRDEENKAVKYFNRAAAFRLFNAYKQEYPTSPELAQMYLDLVRLYTATGETEVAAATLAEFEQRYADAPQYADVALRLADAYIAAGKSDEERATYQRIMDYLGKKRPQGMPLMPGSQQMSDDENRSARRQVLNISSEPTEVKPSPADYNATSYSGIEIPRESGDEVDSSYSQDSKYEDYLDQPVNFKSSSSDDDGSSDEGSDERRHQRRINHASSVDYPTVLERYVSSLAKDNRTGDILALYSAEIKKYPQEPALYEQMLQWLGQTNLVEEQLRVYQEALKQFPTMLWRDRMARWFLRFGRKQEFASFSRAILESLDDDEMESYLDQFVGSDFAAAPSSFDANLYLGLYSFAHERFPHDLRFVQGLLKFYSVHDQWEPWRKLMAEYYFESREIRDKFLAHLAKGAELRAKLDQARAVCNANAQAINANAQEGAAASSLTALPYKLFRADAAVWLSNYEEAIDAYRELNRLYPNTPEFSERLIAFTRSLGQHNRRFLEESASAAHDFADAFPASPEYRTRAGEIQAELGEYSKARGEWERLVALGPGEPENYLETATLYWDYFQYEDALRTIKDLRGRLKDERPYAFQAGAILEARHQVREALSEYVKALVGDETDANEVSYETVVDESRARRRLETLYKRAGIPAQLDQAFSLERRHSRNAPQLVLAYARVLKEVEQWRAASALLRQEVARNDSQGFLDQALDLFNEAEDAEGSHLTLKRLVSVARSPRFAISYRLKLAGAYQEAGQRGAAAATLRELVQKFPTNYGVLSEAANVYRRMGQRENSLRILRAGMERGKGRYHYIFARKLAAQELEAGQTAAAERILRSLHDEDHLNTEVFHELAGIYVRTGNREALKRSFHVTLDAIKQQDIDIKEMRMEIADLRGQMIKAFTELKDYNAGIEQYIEIINRDPDDEDKLDQALAYAKRYGGAEMLLSYYQRLSQQAYKNYRWNVVLARIFEAQGDLGSAARNYRAAIDNQPEMVELYDALAGVYTRSKNYDAALEALGKATELSNDDPQYIKQTVELLLKAGRTREAEIARRKLPAEEPKQQTLDDQFAQAASLRSSERSKSIEAYRQAWNAFSAEPYKHDLQASELTGYVQTVRDEEGLDQIMQRLWAVRERLIQDAEREGSVQAGKALSLLRVFDGAIPEALGGVAASKGTGDELTALFRWLQQRMEESTRGGGVDKYGTLALLQNLSRRAGFGSLDEKILIAQKDGAHAHGNSSLHHEYLRRLSDFYSERGDYKRVLDLLEEEMSRDVARSDFDYPRLMADSAHLVGDTARELRALRDYYERASVNNVSQADPMVERYFEALYAGGEEGRNELVQRAQHPSGYHLQLVNFLLRRGDKELAHLAIENASLPLSWKLARNAEASLALKDFDARSEAYFIQALQYQSIGELIKQRPDASVQLVGDDWFHLAEKYGQWLYLSGGTEQRAKTRALLPAMIENRPQDEDEQASLARWYLDQQEAQKAIEHFRLALEPKPEDKQSMAGQGSAYFLLGDKRKAEELWARIIGGAQPPLPDCELYLRTLARHGLAAEARERLLPILTAQLKETKGFNDYYEGKVTNKDFEKLKPLLRALSASFKRDQDDERKDKKLNATDEAARVAFFRRACEAAPDNTLLPEMLIRESLVGQDQLGQFYQLLVEHSAVLSSYESDYEYVGQLQKSWNAAETEEALDQEQDFKVTEPKARRLDWQKEYLAYLIERHETRDARQLIRTIESDLARRYARPVWLRLAALRLDVREGQTANAYNNLKRFVGIEAGESITKISPPDTVRLNEAVEMLRREGQDALASQLLEAAYARAIALEQYEPSYFVSLSRSAFARGDAALGLKMLQAMVNLSDGEARPEALAWLASLPSIKPYALEDTSVELPESHDGINRAGALQLAALTAGEFAQFDAAITYRQQLLAFSPEDEANRLELVHLLFASGKDDEAIGNLADIISDRNATRGLRWQAVWLSPEIAGRQPERWASLRERVRSAKIVDQEMNVALEAVSLSSGGRAVDALKLLSAIETENPNPQLKYFHALLEKQSGHEMAALEGFVNALISSQDAEASRAFAFKEDASLPQLVRLYLALGQPRAALQLAEREPALRAEDLDKNDAAVKADEVETDDETNDETNDETREDKEAVVPTQDAAVPPKPERDERHAYMTLDALAEERRAETRLSLLGLLSEAAEQTGDLDRALKLARGRLTLLPAGALREAAAVRLERLLALQRAHAGAQESGAFTVDQKLVAQR